MKKFLVFLVAIITTVCIGITFYQFAKNDEVIKVNTETIYINYGDKLSLEDIGFSRKEASKETKINFNAGGDEVTSIIKYDELSNCYIPTSKGGSTTIKISTTNRKYKSFSIDVVVGIGTEEFPYYISNEQQLFDITNANIDKNACFKLVKDITLTNVHSPIGLTESGYREFDGKFDGNGKTISNLKIESCDYAGLFAIIGANSQVYDLKLSNSVLDGSFINVGTIAGTCFGTINKVIVTNSVINNTKTGSNTGAIVGLLQTDNLNSTSAGILRSAAYTDNNNLITANGNLGGLAGSVNSAIIHACHTRLCLKNTSTSPTGGLIGNLIVDNNTYVRESYAVTQIEAGSLSGNIIGSIALKQNQKIEDISKELVLVGLYYENSLNKFAGVASDINNFASASSFAVNGKTANEMKSKNTYIYYINSASNIVYWDKVWYLVDGEYPILTFTGEFDDIILDDENNQTTPDISDPETPNLSVTIISNKQQLLSAFQGKNSVSGNYVLGANIDLEGINWTPVKFNGTFKSSQKQNYIISNFKIVADNMLYAGFFYDSSSSTISNITFNNVSVQSSTPLQATGIVVGHVRGNTVISNVKVINAKIDVFSKYSGGIAGYINNVITKLDKCQVQSLNISKALNVGGIAGYTSNNTYLISCKVRNSNNINGVDRIGGIVAVNYGSIYDCLFNGNIKATTSSTGYYGGLVGVNYSKLLNSTTYAEIEIVNTSPTDSKQYSFVGGLVGYNLGTISRSNAYADNYSAIQSTGVVYLGGLTGYNANKIEYSVADVTSIGSVNSNIYTAGLSVFNYGGNIFGCFTFGNLNGYQVAGLVRTNTNDGIVDSCMAGLSTFERATYKAVQVVSFAYDISSGTISNCIVNANLTCANSKGWIAGFAGFMPCTNGKFGTISHSIANVSFNGVGNKYLDIAQDGLMKKNRTTGTVTNCIINKEATVGDVMVSEYSKTLWFTNPAGSKSNYIVATNEDLLKIETYLNPETCNFDISTSITKSKWLYINNTLLPLPRPYLEVFGYDIIGL